MPKRNDYPTQNEILTALDQEDARQKEALRKYLHRQEPQLHVTGKTIIVFFGWFFGVLAAVCLYGWYADWLRP